MVAIGLHQQGTCAFKGTAELDCLQYLIAKWYANMLEWEISCLVICHVTSHTESACVYIYIYIYNLNQLFFVSLWNVHIVKKRKNHNKKNTNYFTLSSGLFTVNDHDPKYAISVVQVNRMLYIAIVS